MTFLRPSISADQPSQTVQDFYKNKKAMALMTLLFFMCGFLATLNDILIPHLKAIFDLDYAEVMTVQFSFFSSFLLFSYPSGKLVEFIGYQKTMAVGLFTMGSGALLFLPAASVPSFMLFAIALVVLAGGVTALQVSGNPYVSTLGPTRTASSRLSLTQAFNSLGSTIAPSIGGVLILRAAHQPNSIQDLHDHALHAYRVHQASYVKGPYLGIAITLFLLGCFIAVQKLPHARVSTSLDSRPSPPSTLWRQRHLTLGVVAMFLYCGAEITIGSFLVNYLSRPEIGALSPQHAATYVSLYWGGSMIGRFVGSALLRRISTGTLVGFNASVAACLVITSIVTTGHVAMWSILLVGTFNSIIFPSLFTLGIKDMGSLTGKASGVMMSAAVGAAVIPVLQGSLADRMGIHYSFLVPALCYLYVVFYGLEGCEPGQIQQSVG